LPYGKTVLCLTIRQTGTQAIFRNKGDFFVNYKITYFFEGTEQALIGTDAHVGWTESWYTPDTNMSVDDVLNHNDTNKYIELRRAFMPDCYRISFVRVTDEATPGVAKFDAPDGKKGTVIDPGERTAVQIAILIDIAKLATQPQFKEKVHHRRFLLRGISNTLFACNTIDRGSGQFPNLRKFLDFIGNHGTGSAPSSAVTPQSRVHGMKWHDPSIIKADLSYIAGFGVRDIIIQPTLQFPVGSKVKLTRVLDPYSLANRTWNVLFTPLLSPVGYPAGSYTVLGRSRHAFATEGLTAGDAPVGEAQLVKNLYGLPDQYTIVGLANKKTGTVFRKLRGRRRGG
jgi:hypothetical protein